MSGFIILPLGCVAAVVGVAKAKLMGPLHTLNVVVAIAKFKK